MQYKVVWAVYSHPMGNFEYDPVKTKTIQPIGTKLGTRHYSARPVPMPIFVFVTWPVMPWQYGDTSHFCDLISSFLRSHTHSRATDHHRYQHHHHHHYYPYHRWWLKLRGLTEGRVFTRRRSKNVEFWVIVPQNGGYGPWTRLSSLSDKIEKICPRFWANRPIEVEFKGSRITRSSATGKWRKLSFTKCKMMAAI